MGFGKLLRGIFGKPDEGRTVEELARRLAKEVEGLRAEPITYRQFTIPKRSGGVRVIAAPSPSLKALQRRILRRLLSRLKCHAAAVGFERGQSIVTNAMRHAGKAVVVKMDLQDFFPSTSAGRVRAYFRKIGWNREASDLLVRLCTYKGGLPQGAPTSPRLSNLVNRGLDARLSGLAGKFGASYSRYADDLTFSFTRDEPDGIHKTVGVAKRLLSADGYKLHVRKKFHIRRRSNRQIVTGLVVNERVNLPRETRRWLRAVAHRLSTGREATLSPGQLAGWNSLRAMVARQAGNLR